MRMLFIATALFLAMGVSPALATHLAPGYVWGFTLINADTDRPIPGYDPIVADVTGTGVTLNLRTLPTRRLNIVANVVGSPGSVEFKYDCMVRDYRVENVAPFTLAGDSGGNYYSWTPTVGTHTLQAVTFSGPRETGTKGPAARFTFTVIDSSSTTQPDAGAGPDAGEYLALANCGTYSAPTCSGTAPLPPGATGYYGFCGKDRDGNDILPQCKVCTDDKADPCWSACSGDVNCWRDNGTMGSCWYDATKCRTVPPGRRGPGDGTR